MVVVVNGSDLSLQGGRYLGEISNLLLLFGQAEVTEGSAVTERQFTKGGFSPVPPRGTEHS